MPWEHRKEMRKVHDDLASITNRCSKKEPALLPRPYSLFSLREECRPDSSEWRKSSLVTIYIINSHFYSNAWTTLEPFLIQPCNFHDTGRPRRNLEGNEKKFFFTCLALKCVQGPPLRELCCGPLPCIILRFPALSTYHLNI